ncbi:uncharacterized protein B0I36DRAFT_402498 [Microdochium trichocladiopsis]|uniref:MYND-type domain-containing protein n=1 Tax=Microdochium trichocladiopsis TaxID=1682393 RepID=A0A9P9BU29_9PEZI|nr:uncharacterized protein B0I36DRAFT_402498 [Microdochium trichocladiopsis]KAH7037034.1 hypothetical protein B0I36DRAFT_402498 [Microdochium trichocladiopsis]
MSEAFCAGWSPESTTCQKTGHFACKGCLLVTYCGSTCQKSHWPQHKIDCKCPVGKTTWQPQWALQNRMPDFVRGGVGEQFGGRKYLWGNMPAYDVLKLVDNEGVAYDGPLTLLFAASGDLRNLFKTLAELPESYTGTVRVTLNDRDLDVVARNIIMLLIALVLEDAEEAIDCILHFWYSCLIRKSHYEAVQARIRPLIQDVCVKIKAKSPGSLQAKTWKLGKHSLRLVLTQSTWTRLLSYMDLPQGLDGSKATRIRQAVTQAESRVDYRDRHLLFFSPAHRVAKTRFWKDGLLLPFGASRDDFVVPNPTFFSNANGWPMFDNADPLSGWTLKEIEATSSGQATADLYGKLSKHIHNTLKSFLHRLYSLRAVELRFLHVDAVKLPELLGESERFDRIEVSNISDCGYVGPHQTVGLLAPLLQTHAMNPHATLITLFMNAVDENRNEQDEILEMSPDGPVMRTLIKYMPPTRRLASKNDPAMIKFISSKDYVASHDRYFDRFVEKFKLTEFGHVCGVTMKNKHTIIEKWPYILRLQPDQKGAQEEFDRLLRSSTSTKERYVEWKRIVA